MQVARGQERVGEGRHGEGEERTDQVEAVYSDQQEQQPVKRSEFLKIQDFKDFGL